MDPTVDWLAVLLEAGRNVRQERINMQNEYLRMKGELEWEKKITAPIRERYRHFCRDLGEGETGMSILEYVSHILVLADLAERGHFE